MLILGEWQGIDEKMLMFLQKNKCLGGIKKGDLLYQEVKLKTNLRNLDSRELVLE